MFDSNRKNYLESWERKKRLYVKFWFKKFQHPFLTSSKYQFISFYFASMINPQQSIVPAVSSIIIALAPHQSTWSTWSKRISKAIELALSAQPFFCGLGSVSVLSSVWNSILGSSYGLSSTSHLGKDSSLSFGSDSNSDSVSVI